MSLVIRVLPDEPAIDREFDYLVPDDRADLIKVGSIVRVDLRGRRVRGWVTAIGVEPPDGVEPRTISKVSGIGPPGPLIELASWASHRWVGTRPRFLRTATPERNVAGIPDPPAKPAAPLAVLDGLSGEAFTRGGAVVRLAPNTDEWPLIAAAANLGRALILTPSVGRAKQVVLQLRRAGVQAALYPRDWAMSAAGAVTVGARAAAWAPITDLDAVLVLDEHDESYQEESAPTWHARDVAIERARRDGAPWVVTSPAPSLESLTSGASLLTPSRAVERAGWPVIEVADRRDDDPTLGEWCGEALTRTLHSGARVVCVINRKGRARLAYCHACGELARSTKTGRALAPDGQRLVDPSPAAGEEPENRPAVCDSCGSTRFRRVKLGVTGVAEALSQIARREVIEVTADQTGPLPQGDLYVGTEAVLHRVHRSDVVAFLDFDQELLAPRYRAADEAMSLLIRAARVVGPRDGGGRVLVQTRMPGHELLDAVLHADPRRAALAELAKRRELNQPPTRSWALVSGPSATEFMERFGTPVGVDVMGPADGRWRLSAQDRRLLLDELNSVERPGGRLRIEVDPLRA
jgi:primosomal protein N' (replication factor Y) (superfamily II helicase)